MLTLEKIFLCDTGSELAEYGTAGDRTYYSIDAVAIDGDPFQTNEGIKVCMIYRTTDCPDGNTPPTVFGVSTSCNLDPVQDICHSSEYSAALDFGAKYPEISQSINSSIAYDPTCLDGSPIKQSWVLTNTGDAPAGSINVRLQEFGGATPIDVTSITYTVAGGPVMTDAVISSRNNTLSGCVTSTYTNSSDLARRMNVTFNNLDLKPGESLIFDYNVYPIPCGCSGCDVNQRLGTVISDIDVLDLCDIVTQDRSIVANSAWPNFDVDIGSFMESPITNCAGSISTLSTTVTNYNNSYLSNQGYNSQDDDERNAVYTPCTDCYFEMTFDLPIGLDYVGGTAVWNDDDGTQWVPTVAYLDNDMGGPDVLVLKWTGQEPSGFDAFNEASVIFFDYTPDCENELDKGPNCSSVLYDVNITKTTKWGFGSCENCIETIECSSSIPVTVKCPGTDTDCICDGFVHTNTQVQRQNLYIPDTANDGTPDPGDNYDQSLIRRDRFVKGDSIKVDMGGYFSNDAIPSFDYLYAVVDFESDEFIPLGGELTIIDALGVTYTCDVLTQTINGNRLVTDLSIPTLMDNGCIVPTTFMDTDSVALTFFYSPIGEFNGDVRLLTQRTQIYAATEEMGSPYNCRLPLDYRMTQVGTQSSFGYFQTDFVGFTGCARATAYYRGYSRIGSAFVDYFPGEYINDIDFLTKFTSTIPTGMVFDDLLVHIKRKNASASLNLGSAVIGNQYPNNGLRIDASHPAVSVVGSQLFFDMATFLSVQNINGGTYPDSDEGYSWSLQPYFVPTCNLSPGPIDDVMMTADHVTNERLFCSSEYVFEEVRSGFSYGGGADIIIEAVDECISVDQFPTCARVRVRNNSPSIADNGWLSFESNSGAFSLASLTRITGGTSEPITGNQYNMFLIGDLSPNAIELYELCMYVNSCGLDSLTVASGYDCLNEPRIIEEAICKSETQILYKPVTGNLSMAIKEPSSDEVLNDLCDTLTYVLNFVGAGPGFLTDLYLDMIMPLDLEYVSGSFEIAYPANPALSSIPPDSDFLPASDPDLLYGNTFRLDISKNDPILSTIGLIGSAGSAFNDNVVNIRFDVETKCGFTSGSRIFFESNAQEGCGNPLALVQKDFGKLIKISDAPEPFVSDISIQADTLNACAAEQTPITINYAISGMMATNEDDSIRVILPAGMTFVPGSYLQGTNPTTDPPVIINASGLSTAYWGIGGLSPGSDATYAFSVQANDIGQECKDYTLLVQTFKSGMAFCDATMEDCVVRSISDEASADMFIDKAELSVISASAMAMSTGADEMINFTIEVENQGNIATEKDADLFVDIYKDANADGRVNDGDIVLGTLEFAVDLGVGESATYTASITTMAGMSCNLLTYIDIAKNCTCKSSSSFSIEADLDMKLPDDVYVCSNERVQLGPINTSYTYGWISLGGSDLTALSSVTGSPVDFIFDNNTGVTIVWDYGLRITRGAGCYTLDTITVHVYPETFDEVSNTVCGPVDNCGDAAYSFSLAGPVGGTNYNWGVESGDVTAVIDDPANPLTTVSSVISEATHFKLTYDDENGCPGEFNQYISLLNCACTSIGDTVWFDLNVNGIQDLAEMGIPGVAVYLYNTNNLTTPIQSTTTDANGYYLFAPLPSGNYTVSFDKSTHTSSYHILEPTLQDVGDDADDSDADLITGFTGAYFLPNGISDLTLDAGFYPGFDLALKKEINTSLSPNPILPGDIVSYDITVINQGGYYEARNIEIVDYIPAGLIYSGGTSGILASANGNVTTISNNGGGSFTIDALQPLDEITFVIELLLTSTTLGTSLVNYAEISDFENDHNLPDSDSYPDAINGNDVGGTPDTSEDNFVDDDGIDSDGDGIMDEDDHDSAILEIPIVDLALIKKYDPLYEPLPISLGALVKFDITVFNQGDIAVQDVVVQDYVPTGLDFDATIPENITEGWTNTGTNTIAGPIPPGGLATTSIYMTVLASTTDDYINAAEILSANDMNGRDVSSYDIDSEPGSNTMQENDVDPNTAGDNNFTSTGIGDTGSEDDHDIAEVLVVYPIFEMEKNHISVNWKGNNCYDLVYEITVTNSGGDVGYYDLVDDPMYDDDFEIISAIFTTNAVGNPGGSLPSATSTYVLADDQLINPLAADIYTLTLEVCIDLEDSSSVGDEVYTSSCFDINGGSDSAPGEGLHNTATLDTNNDNTPDLTDETCVDVPYFTIDKSFVGVNVLADGTYDITYTITVSNLGGIADDYNLNDTPGFDNDITINSASFTSDTGLSNAGLTVPVPTNGWPLAMDQVLDPGETDNFTIVLNVSFDFSDGVVGDDTYSSCAATSGSSSNPGQGLYNEAALDVNDDGQPDLMDSDCEDIEAFDLALTKVLSPSQTTPVTIGSTVIYEIEVCNQGTVDAYDIEVVEYLPTALDLSDPNWFAGTDPNEYFRTIAGPITPGNCEKVQLVTTVNAVPINGMIDNYAEINSAEDQDGNVMDDVDSDPDNSNTNDGDVNDDNTSNEDNDEDDHDIASIPVVMVNCLISSNSVVCPDAALMMEEIGTGNTAWSWSGPSGFTASTKVVSINPPVAGTYFVTVTQSDGLTNQCQTTVEVSPVLTLSAIVTDVNCRMGADGAINLSTSGGATPLTFDWSNDGPESPDTDPQSISALTAGSYAVTVTDANGCSTTASYVVTEPSAELECGLMATNISCNDGADGTISVTASGGTLPYEYSLNGGAYQPGNAFSGLSAGTHNVMVRDDSDCLSTCSIMITEPAELVCSTNVTNDDSCVTDNGMISVTALGGTAPFTYSINGDPFQSASIFTGLAEGTYSITTRDNNGCEGICEAVLTSPTLPFCTIIASTNISCNGFADGSILVDGSLGSGSYDFSNDNGVTWQSTGSFTGLTAGTYSVVVRNSDTPTCTSVCSVTLTEPQALSCMLTGQDVSCNGFADGSISVTLTGGIDDYAYSLNGGTTWQLSNVFSGLEAGTYTVTARDNDDNTCNTTCMITLDEPTVLTSTIVADNLSCNSDNTGGITINGSGGTTPYEYSLNGAAWQPGNMYMGLPAGTHNVSMRDANGCLVMQSVILTEPTELFCFNGVTDATNCETNDGTVTVSASGGTMSYQYSIDGGAYQSSNVFTGLMPGTHMISVQDVNGCTSTCEATINAPSTPMCQIISMTDVECYGMSTGAVTVIGSGGVTPYEFSIDNATWQSSGIFSGLPAGMHAVYIRNASSIVCVSMCAFEIEQPEEIQCLLTPNDPLCNAGTDGNITVIATEGTPGYEYSINGGAWQPGHVFMGLSAGSYTVTIRDNNGCTKSCSTTLGEPDLLICNTTAVDLLCNGDMTGSITVSGAGGTGAYDYNINGGFWQDDNVFSNLAAGNYLVEIRDEYDCTSTCTVTVSEPPLLECNLVQLVPESCAFNDGVIEVNATGGTLPVSYSLDGGSTTQATGLFTGLTLGVYTITIVDANGCIVTCEHEILPDCYDLALTKKLVTPGPYSYGQYVVFDIEVINQGNIDATNVEVTDHVPCGFTYEPGRLINLANDWTLFTTSFPMSTIANLSAQSRTTLQIELKVEMCTMANGHVNVAEISEAFDPNGNPGDDVDSDPDYNPNDDEGGDFDGPSNDQEDGNGTDDEDDHDPEFVPIYDNSLSKTLVTPGPFNYGQLVEYAIEVCNESSPQVTNLVITDHVPAGYSFDPLDNPSYAWTGAAANGPVDVTHTITTILNGGECVTVPIFLTMEMAGGYSDWYNTAEISSFTDEDNDPRDDVDSDEENDDGDQSEDDEDGDGPEVVDAALVKTTTASGPFRYGDVVTYDFTIYNQGNVDLQNIVFNDSLPCGQMYLASNSPDWSFDSGSSIVTTMIDGPILPGNSMTVSISVELQACTADPMGAWTNIAEIESFQDGEGDERTDDDIDSEADDNFGNDSTDDNTNDNSNGDEDDNDPETVEIYDLAQAKKLLTDGPYTYGDTLEYEICIVNHGNVTANMFTVTDHLPVGLGFDASLNPGWDATNAPAYDYVVSSALTSADTFCITMFSTFEMTQGGVNNYKNIAEISGDDGTDADSTDDDNPDNDDNPVDNSLEDEEDDHDPENFEVVDAALTKTTTDMGPFKYGDQIVFDINVFNQGNIDLHEIKVNDFVPCGFKYLASNDVDWSYDGAGVATTTIAEVEAGASVTVSIALEFQQCLEVDAFKNVSEIESFQNEEGDDVTDRDVDSDGDAMPDNDGDMSDNDKDNENGDEDDSDFEEPRVFDLAQIKQIVTPMPYAYGDTIEYSICVVNHGNVTAQNITLTDHLPEGLGFDATINVGWDDTNAPSYDYIVNGPLVHGDTICVPAFMTIDMTMGGGTDHTNISEISYAEDAEGTDRSDNDADSSADNDPDNDGDVDDDSYFDEEDDHDIANLMVIDAALAKTTSDSGPFEYGDDITFNIEVTNQGNIDLYDVKVNDFIPCGFEYLSSNDADWTYDGVGVANTTIDGPIRGGQTVIVPITVRLQYCAEIGAYKNTAEIESFKDEKGGDITDQDVDSDGDNDPDNDGEMEDNVTDNSDGDEDDSDFEEPEVFDLALIKQLVTPLPYGIGDLLQFNLTLVNQGNVTATNISVLDHLPPGFSFSAADNVGWDDTYAPVYEYIVSDLVEPLDTIVIPFYVTLEVAAGGVPSYTNTAEVGSAQDEDGGDRSDDDADSTPDDNPDNDEDSEDDSFDDDEDDHDTETVVLVDAALRKTVATAGPYKYGDVLTFNIELFNQGVIDLYEIKVNDFIPCGYEYLSSNDGVWSYDSVTGIATATYAGPLSGGSSDMLTIDLRLVSCSPSTSDSWTNVAEIESFQNEDGEDITDEDVDSEGDDDPINDTTIDDDVDNKDGDEDDNDPATVKVFDLALEKSVNLPDPFVSLGDTIEYWISIYNQGNVIAEKIEVVDYLDAPLLYDASLNTGWSLSTPNLEYTADGPLLAGDTLHIPLILIIDPDAVGFIDVLNFAEISGSLDDQGNDRTNDDIDSDADDNAFNDPGGEPGGDSDGEILDNGFDADGDGVADEDDHDPVRLILLECHDLACIGNINLSLDNNCTAEITGAMLLEYAPNDPDLYEITITDDAGNVVNNLFDFTQIGTCYNVSVGLPDCDANTCWSRVCIEDKFAPTIDCGLTQEVFACSAAVADLSAVTPPVITDNCGGASLVLVNEVITINDDCDPDDLLATVVRSYKAVDAQGNESAVCDQTIEVKRVVSGSIVFPADFTSNVCTTSTDISVTGVPTIGGVSIYPINQSATCNLMVSYVDLPVGEDSCHKIFVRTWTIREWWCGSVTAPITYGQRIEINDQTAPTINCPSDMTVKTDGGFGDCIATFTLPAATVSDDCNAPVEVDIETGVAFIDGNGGTASLEVGTHTIKYIAYDGCYNSSECTMTVTVRDETQPTILCEQNTVVSLQSTGTVEVFAGTLDDGSFDDCALDRFEVRRMEDSTFGESVIFDCTDVGADVMVVMRVYDLSGNHNECMVSVEVQDKNVATINCLANVNLSCPAVYDLNNLASQFGMPTVSGTCSSNIVITESAPVVNIDNCGVGTIRRRFTAPDGVGGTLACTQVIRIVNDDPIDVNDIVWPLDFSTTSMCDFTDATPDNLAGIYGYPVISEDVCDLVGVDFADQEFTFANDPSACFKILRTWTVIDWCQRNTDGTYITWTHVQEIKINNDTDPTIDSGLNNIVVESNDVNCSGVFVTLGITASDDCPSNMPLNYSYEIDLNSDGTTDQTGTSSDASGSYPIGIHRIYWIVLDGCGNEVQGNHMFEVRNVKAPIAICLQGLSVNLTMMDTDGDNIPDTNMAILWASDFDKGSNHPCGYDVQLSLSSDVDSTSVIFDCSQLGQQGVQLWVTDSNGNQSFCSTFVVVQDNDNNCPLNGMMLVGGRIFTEEDESVEEVEVSLEGSGIEEMTEDSGEYAFDDMPMGGTYTIDPSKNSDVMNGVSTLDLVLIQKHILQTQLLKGPYKQIAADINHDERISAIDLIQLRKLILGIYEEYPENESWRFVDAMFEFPEGADPLELSFPESYAIPSLGSNMWVNFVGVKIGDVNGSVVANWREEVVETRSSQTLELVYEDERIQEGKQIRVAVSSMNFDRINGLQLTLEHKGLRLVEVEGEALKVTNGNVGMLSEGLTTMSWHEGEGKELTVGKDKALFTLVFEGDRETTLSEVVRVTSTRTTAEAYREDAKTGTMMIMPISIEAQNGTDIIKDRNIRVHQNEPNPWKTSTMIRIDAVKREMATLQVRDALNRVVLTKELNLEEGINEVMLRGEEIPNAGIYYYHLVDADSDTTRSMIKIN